MTTRALSIDAIVQDPQMRGGRPVIAALFYYYSHREEIDEEIRANAREAERCRRELGERTAGG